MFSSCIKRQVNAMILGKCHEDFLESIVRGCREYRDKSGKVEKLVLVYASLTVCIWYLAPLNLILHLRGWIPKLIIEKSQQRLVRPIDNDSPDGSNGIHDSGGRHYR